MKASVWVLLLYSFLVLFAVSAHYGCKKSAFPGKLFCYPPSSKPHESTWTYLGSVLVKQSEKGSFSKRSVKSIYITVRDRQEKLYLNDELEVYCAGLHIATEWDQFEELEITLIEKGNKFAEDDYNKKLIENGPNTLIQLKYSFDDSLNKFVRAKTID